MILENISKLQEKYDLELDKAVKEIKKIKKKSPKIIIQLPDGLKPAATDIVDYLQSKTKAADIRIWLGTCYGACDLPKTDADLVIQFGHAEWTSAMIK